MTRPLPLVSEGMRTRRPSLSYYAAVDKRETIFVIAAAAWWILNGVLDWRGAQRRRAESHQPRTFRDDALMIVAAIFVVVGTFLFMPRNATHLMFAAVFIGLVVVVYFLLHRAGERRPRSTDGSESSANPPSAHSTSLRAGFAEEIKSELFGTVETVPFPK